MTVDFPDLSNFKGKQFLKQFRQFFNISLCLKRQVEKLTQDKSLLENELAKSNRDKESSERRLKDAEDKYKNEDLQQKNRLKEL